MTQYTTSPASYRLNVSNSGFVSISTPGIYRRIKPANARIATILIEVWGLDIQHVDMVVDMRTWEWVRRYELSQKQFTILADLNDGPY